MLRGSAGLVVAVAAGTALTACETGPSDDEKAARALVPHAQSARNQQEQAQALAPRQTGQSDRFTQIADERGAHLQALTDEINRLHAPFAGEITSGAVPRVDAAALLSELRTSAQSAAKTATEQSGYRAALLGSISAACAVLQEVSAQ